MADLLTLDDRLGGGPHARSVRPPVGRVGRSRGLSKARQHVSGVWPASESDRGQDTHAVKGPLSQEALAHPRLDGLVPVDGRWGSPGCLQLERSRDGCREQGNGLGG